MRYPYRLTACALALSALLTGPARATSTDAAAPADSPGGSWLPLGLEAYEPSAFGYSKYGDDVHYFNFKLSAQYPLMPNATRHWWGPQDRVYVSFTGVFGFYLGDRYSSPVVGKEYNPQLFWQHLWSCKDAASDGYRPGPSYGSTPVKVGEGDSAEAGKPPGRQGNLNCFVTVGYNHDSNGQTIDSLSQYQATVRDQGVAAANDAISRGWDYLGVTARFIPYWSASDRITLYPMLKYFLSDGLLQGRPEELHDWESPPDAKPRKEVDGLSVLMKYQRQVGRFDSMLALAYTTGYLDAFRYSTVRVEAGITVFEVPIVVWTQKGYLSDLAQYYRNVTGYGVQVEIGAF